MSRIIILGNAGGGKSTLARKIARSRDLPHFEIDKFLWLEGWAPAPMEIYASKHGEVISGDTWVIDGVGHWNSIPARVERATEIILIDMPLWMHFWLAAERQIVWASGELADSPGGFSAMPPTRDLFRTIWEIDQERMPGIRALCTNAERDGKTLHCIRSVDALEAFSNDLDKSE
ncbi:adenylate kinase [Rhizobium sp. BR 315]|uniref:adenylate kinase n=1 Tax=Rhizobium sp. BR 315 TaxID=3040014 RepID=UPI003D33E1AB